MTGDHKFLDIPESFNTRMKEKYNSDLEMLTKK